MEIEAGHRGREAELVDLFQASFSESEGETEGALIAQLVSKLMDTPSDDLFIFTAHAGEVLMGGLIFSRLRYAHDKRSIFVLGPVAVAPGHQSKGVGQQLIAAGLDALRRAGVDIAMTYGDPAYYGRVGFRPISEAEAQAPFPLQHPEGWQSQSLTGQAAGALSGPSRCVEALNDPIFW